MKGCLYLVGTPIGNLGDFSPRAVEIFSSVDFIAAEDTRVTVKLLNHFNIKKPLVSYYEHNRLESGEKIISRILGGETCALVSDAGMPAISDPGEELVAMCAENGIDVFIVPGPCAAVSALALSGLPTGRFTFEGFLSTAKKSRFDHLNAVKSEKRTMIFYEAPHKLLATLRDMLSVFGDRRIAVCRELTKLHEETMRTTLNAAFEYFSENAPRGEFVLVIDGAKESGAPDMTFDAAVEKLRRLIDGGMSLKAAAKLCAEETDFTKNSLYEAALKFNE